MNRPSRDLLAEVFPDVPLTSEVAEFGTLLSVDRAKQVIGYVPAHSWRDESRTGNSTRDPTGEPFTCFPGFRRPGSSGRHTRMFQAFRPGAL